MRLDEAAVREGLADAWERWARRAHITAMVGDDAVPTMDVRGRVAHLCPDPSMFDMLTAATIDAPAAVVDAAEMLRRFSAPGGIAHTSADQIAERATTEPTALTHEAAVTLFTECAEILRATTMSNKTVISYSVVGSTTLAVVAEVASTGTTVHLLDLADAVGDAQPSVQALVATRDLLIAVGHRLGDRGSCRSGRSVDRGAGNPVTGVTPFTASVQLCME